MALVILALFVTLALLFVALVFIVVTALIAAIAFADCCEPYVVYPHSSRRRTTSPPHHGLATAVLSSPSLLGFPPLADASLTRPCSSLPHRILIIAGHTAALQYFHEVQ